MNAKAHRANRADPVLDIHGRRIVCGVCRMTIAWDRGSRNSVVAIPAGLTDEETSGVYRWSIRAEDKLQEGVTPRVQRRDRPPGYTPEQWERVGWIRFARLPCVIPCRDGHANDLDTAVLASIS